MNLGLAQELIRRDPEAAAALIARGHGVLDHRAGRPALAGPRHPSAGAGRPRPGRRVSRLWRWPSPLEVELDIDLAGRPPAPVESAVYFAVAEALTNAAKYAAAQDGSGSGSGTTSSTLTAMVGDDGVGGAQFTPEGGLAGIERRLAAFDGDPVAWPARSAVRPS